MRRVVNATRKQKLPGAQVRLLDQLVHRVAGNLRDLELHGRRVSRCVTLEASGVGSSRQRRPTANTPSLVGETVKRDPAGQMPVAQPPADNP